MINTIEKQSSNFLRMIFCILTFITPVYMINQYSSLVVDELILKFSIIIVFIFSSYWYDY